MLYRFFLSGNILFSFLDETHHLVKSLSSYKISFSLLVKKFIEVVLLSRRYEEVIYLFIVYCFLNSKLL